MYVYADFLFHPLSPASLDSPKNGGGGVLNARCHVGGAFYASGADYAGRHTICQNKPIFVIGGLGRDFVSGRTRHHVNDEIEFIPEYFARRLVFNLYGNHACFGIFGDLSGFALDQCNALIFLNGVEKASYLPRARMSI